MADILIVEDKESFATMLKASLEDESITAQLAKDGRAALRLFKKEKFEIALIDMKLPDIDGIELLRQLKRTDTDTKFLIMTAFGTIERAVEAMKLGAYDFLTKPFDVEQLIALIQRILQEQRRYYENILLRDEMSKIHGAPEIIGKGPAVKHVAELLQKAAPTDTTVLIVGESGTGKELFARACHMLSPRKDNPFVAINCAAIPHQLLEHELFGSEKGAFTGAVARKIGKFELANKGTVFLDEVGDLDLDLQAKLLRVLQEMNFERLGGTYTINIDVRIIAATNRDLMNLVKEKKFREDLYYRLSVFPIRIPPLRERKEDLRLLVDHILRKLHSDKNISPRATEKLSRYDWPGNIRELENTIERANIIAKKKIQPEDILLPERKVSLVKEELPRTLKAAASAGRELAEVEVIKKTLEQTQNNKSEAARRIGVSYKTLLSRIKKYRKKGLL
ncbi:MAG: sigma-54-dependent Fis family transcriptional regulator [candidate division WOR-3 bacterium]|nr:MAG: sigma-54-dependent Fis family transcriptional regulator [candidate division WOR-3 bacterium]